MSYNIATNGIKLKNYNVLENFLQDNIQYFYIICYIDKCIYKITVNNFK